MAFTVVKNIGVANVRSSFMKVTADGAEANIGTGLSNIFGGNVSIQSAATAGWNFYFNADSSGTASPGIVGLSGVVSGDIIYITVHGV